MKILPLQLGMNIFSNFALDLKFTMNRPYIKLTSKKKEFITVSVNQDSIQINILD